MKGVLVLFLLGVVLTTQAISFNKFFNNSEWLLFKFTHNRSYKNQREDNFRRKVYATNMHKIIQHNRKYNRKQVSYKLGMNKYGDMLPHEFIHTLNGFNKTKHYDKTLERKGATFIEPANVELPAKIDWRFHGAVTDVKDQGHCGSCWAFSSTGALEGQHFRRTGYLVSLSEQNLIDCSRKFGNQGCAGGLMDQAFQYIKENKGIDTEQSYPYEAVNDQCRYNPTFNGADDVGYVDIQPGNEQKLKAAVATIGPISVAIDASQESFQFYNKGVYYDPNCSSETLDHGVLVVGYGTDPTGGDYWLVKNSWGSSWGESGYIKMARNRQNHCGIASSASYPLV